MQNNEYSIQPRKSLRKFEGTLFIDSLDSIVSSRARSGGCRCRGFAQEVGTESAFSLANRVDRPGGAANSAAARVSFSPGLLGVFSVSAGFFD